MITKVNPVEYLRPIDRFNKMMEDLWGETPVLITPWSPAVDIKETPSELVFMIELPGIHEEDVEVEVRNENMLVVRGRREMRDEEKREDYVRIERHYGAFERMFTLNQPVLVDKIVALFRDGILTVTIPKVAAPKPLKVPIHKP